MTSIFRPRIRTTQLSTSMVTQTELEIPQEILKKAAESALVSSFVDLNLHAGNIGGNITKGKFQDRKISTTSTSQSRGQSQSNKVVIEIDMGQSQEGIQKTNENHKVTSIFVKSIPKNAQGALKEVKIYDQLMKELYPSRIPKIRGPSKVFADCYLTHQNGEYMIFLENLKNLNFKSSSEENVGIDFNHALIAVEALAKFHAQSYFLLRQFGSKAKGRLAVLKKYPYLQVPSSTSPAISKYSKIHAKFFEQIVLKVVELENPSLAFKLRRKYQDSEALYGKMWDILENEKYDNDNLYVVIHGDFRADHLLFKYSDDGVGMEPEPIEARIVDLKNFRLAPLASDLVYFMFTSLDEKMRNEFEEKLIAFYCDSFEGQLSDRYIQEGGELSENDFDIEDFHRKVEDQYKRMFEFGFHAIVTALPLIYSGFPGILENLEEIHLDGVPTSPSVLDSLENADKFQQLAKECLTSEDLKSSIMGVVKRLVRARIF